MHIFEALDYEPGTLFTNIHFSKPVHFDRLGRCYIGKKEIYFPPQRGYDEYRRS